MNYNTNQQDSITKDKLCPYCKTNCTIGEPADFCPSCKTAHHPECWQENHGCAMFGCEQAPDTEKFSEMEIPISYWGKNNKPCPSCGKEIIATAIRCRNCGACFKTARPIDENEYEQQQEIKKQIPPKKKIIVILFVFNMIPVFAPFAAIISLFWFHINKKVILLLPNINQVLIKIGIIVGFTQTIIILLMTVLYSLIRQ